MATINGSTSSSVWTFKLEVTESATSAEDNTSSVKVDVYIGRSSNSGSYMYGAKIPCTVKCTGVSNKSFTYSNSNRVDIAAGAWLKIGSVTFTGVPHNADGAKTVTVSASFTNNVSPSSGSASGSFTLTTLARASQPSCITYPNHTQNVGNFGDTISVHMNRQSSTFTHRVRYAFGNLSGTCIDADTGAAATAVGTGFRWKIPESFMGKLPATVSGSGTIYVDTYSGTKLIGTKYCGFTATIPSTVKPSCTVAVSDATSVYSTYGAYVKGLSKLKVVVTPTTAYGSPIASYKVLAVGETYAQASFTTDVLKFSGTRSVEATVTDKRGRSYKKAVSLNILDYSAPHITDLSIFRCNSDGTENARGAYVHVEFSAKVTALSNKNTATYKLRYKKTGADTFTEVELTSYENVYTVTNGNRIFAADVDSSYIVEVSVTDNHGAFVSSTQAPTAFTLINWGTNGTSMAVGKIAEKANTLENALSLNQIGNRYTLSTPGVSGTQGFIRMATIEVIAANADTPITFVFSSRQAVAPMTVHVSLRNSTATSSSVGSITYEGANYDAYLAPDSALTWGLYVKKGSNYDTITLQDWYTSNTMMSRVEVTFPGTLVDQVPTPYYKATPAQLRSLLDYIYPVDSVYISYSHKNPAEMFGGTWVRISNAFLWAVDANGEIGLTGGEKTLTLTVNELPSHTHGSVYSGNVSGTKTHSWLASGGSNMAYGTVAAGGGAEHNNMPPYIQVSVWRRTA